MPTKLLLNFQNKFANVVIHLGDFHFMKEGFNCIRKLTEGSGFEDIVFQSGMFMSDSMNSVISGSHYNCCWRKYMNTLLKQWRDYYLSTLCKKGAMTSYKLLLMEKSMMLFLVELIALSMTWQLKIYGISMSYSKMTSEMVNLAKPLNFG